MQLDSTLKFIKQMISQFSHAKAVYLFGSRAKGQFKETSDYDLAFDLKLDAQTESKWAELTELLREKNPSLNTLDLVRLDLISPEFREKILDEGILISGPI